MFRASAVEGHRTHPPGAARIFKGQGLPYPRPMGRVVYSVASSLDGFNTDAQGDFSWAVPDEEVIAALTADAADVSTAAAARRAIAGRTVVMVRV
jgi:hypothetical protein